jgi:hypothetical protein
MRFMLPSMEVSGAAAGHLWVANGRTKSPNPSSCVAQSVPVLKKLQEQFPRVRAPRFTAGGKYRDGSGVIPQACGVYGVSRHVVRQRIAIGRRATTPLEARAVPDYARRDSQANIAPAPGRRSRKSRLPKRLPLLWTGQENLRLVLAGFGNGYLSSDARRRANSDGLASAKMEKAPVVDQWWSAAPTKMGVQPRASRMPGSYLAPRFLNPEPRTPKPEP